MTNRGGSGTKVGQLVLAAWVVAVLDGGMHWKEVRSQLWHDVDFANNTIKVTDSKKCRKGRCFPLTARAKQET